MHSPGAEAGSYLRLVDSCITQLEAQDLLGPVTRVKKKKKKCPPVSDFRISEEVSYLRLIDLCITQL